MYFKLFGKSKKKTKNNKKVPKAVKDALLNKYFKKKTSRKCFCCRRATIDIINFEVGHNKAKSKGGSNHISNLRPICRSCNRSMGNKYTIDAFRKKFFGSKKELAKKKPKKKKVRTKKRKNRKLKLKFKTFEPVLNFNLKQ